MREILFKGKKKDNGEWIEGYEGLVLPAGYEAELLSTGGTRQFDTNAIINRYDAKIAQTVMADFIMLGHEQTGSFALSEDKTELFAVALDL